MEPLCTSLHPFGASLRPFAPLCTSLEPLHSLFIASSVPLWSLFSTPLEPLQYPFGASLEPLCPLYCPFAPLQSLFTAPLEPLQYPFGASSVPLCPLWIRQSKEQLHLQPYIKVNMLHPLLHKSPIINKQKDVFA